MHGIVCTKLHVTDFVYICQIKSSRNLNVKSMRKLSIVIILCLSFYSYSQVAGSGLTDIDGNNYNSVIIGTQEWQKENLNVSKYSDGTPIPQVQNLTQWASLTTGAWCYLDNDPANGPIYGKLYNWYAVNDPRGLAPNGYHVPSEVEWTNLITFLGQQEAGGAMKETGTSHWISPNVGATNSSGFTGLPGAVRDAVGAFGYQNTFGVFWSSTSTVTGAWSHYLFNANTTVGNQDSFKRLGYSVRCINDITLKNEFFDGGSFRIYPNPAKDKITIDLGNQTNNSGWSYKIVNMLGQEVITGVITSQQSIVPLDSLSGKGMYFVKIYDDANNIQETKKIIVN